MNKTRIVAVIVLIFITCLLLRRPQTSLGSYNPSVTYESRELLQRLEWKWTAIRDGANTFFIPRESHLIGGEQGVMQLIKQTLVNCTPNEIVIDVGANIGHITLLSAMRNCTTFAFELQIACLDMLRASLRLNQATATIVRRPVSDKVGVKLKMARETECNGMYSTQWAGDEELETTTLDALFPYPAQVKLLKIDIEGHEVHALMGATNMFREGRVDLAIVEASWWPNYWPGPELLAAFKLVANLVYDNGYRIKCIGSTVGGSIEGMQYDSKEAFLGNFTFLSSARINMMDGSTRPVIYCSELVFFGKFAHTKLTI